MRVLQETCLGPQQSNECYVLVQGRGGTRMQSYGLQD